MSGLRRLSAVLVLSALAGASPADDRASDGRWELQISGHQAFVFGDSGLGGGVRIPWEVVVTFQIRDGEYQIGSASARWLDRVSPLSQPPGWFACRQVDGTYLDSSLTLHETPRVRFSGFPVAGAVRDGRVLLQPGYEPPGNYLAVTYECVNDQPRADNWLALAERGKQVLGKRQDAETRVEANRQVARVREVAALPPESQIDLPLQDGWTFSQGTSEASRAASYVLRRLDPEPTR